MVSPDGIAQQSSSDEIERAIALVFSAAKVGQLIFSGLMVLADWRRYKKPWLELGLFVGAVAETAWLLDRTLKPKVQGGRLYARLDAGFAVLGLLACRTGLADRGANWMKNLAIGAVMGAATSESSKEAAALVAAVSSGAIVVGLRPMGRDAHLGGAALAFNDAISWTGIHVAARSYVLSHRRYAVSLDRAGNALAAQARRAAVDAERVRQHRELHDGAVRVLRKLSSVGDVDEAVLLAGREAGRLRSALTSDRMRVPCLAASLRLMLAEERSSSGLRVELVDAELTADVNAAAAETITEVLRQAFALAAGQRGANRVVVRVRSTGDLVVITLRFHGQGMAQCGELAQRRSLKTSAQFWGRWEAMLLFGRRQEMGSNGPSPYQRTTSQLPPTLSQSVPQRWRQTRAEGPSRADRRTSAATLWGTARLSAPFL